MCVFMFAYVSVKVRYQGIVLLSHILFVETGIQRNGELTNWLEWQASEFQGSMISALLLAPLTLE